MSRRKRKKYKQIRHQRYVTRKVYKIRRRRHRGRSSSHRKVHYSAQSKANKHKHYSHLVQILEYNVLFGSEHKPTFNELLAYIPREMAIKIAGTINNLYGNAELEKLNRFSAPSLHFLSAILASPHWHSYRVSTPFKQPTAFISASNCT